LAAKETSSSIEFSRIMTFAKVLKISKFSIKTKLINLKKNQAC